MYSEQAPAWAPCELNPGHSLIRRPSASLRLPVQCRLPTQWFSSIQRLEAIVGRLLLAGFVLLTIGLAIGGYDLLQLGQADAHRGDPKVIWSVLVWLLYLGLVVMRWKFAQGGRRFALGAIGTFVFVLLTFWGVNLLSPIHNQ